MASAAAAALMLSFSTAAWADCAEEIAALKSQQYTGSIDPSEEPGAPEELIDEGTATAEATQGGTGAAPEEETYQGSATADATGEAGVTSEEQPDEGTATADATQGDKKPVAGQVPGTQATAAMNKAVGGRATSPADVRAQDLGEATAAQKADAAEEAPEVDTQIAAADASTEADQFAALLKRAEEYQKLGNEEACMNVVEEARGLVQ
jgi:hypothetical protein